MKICFLCKKGSALGGRRSFLRSHYNPTTKVRKYPNLQWAVLPYDLLKAGKPGIKRAKICVKCLKTVSRSK